MRANPSVDELVSRAREGDARAVARLISWVEDEAPQLREVMAALAPYAGHACGSSSGGQCAPGEFRVS